MYQAKYVHSLPPEEYSTNSYIFSTEALLVHKVNKKFKPLTFWHFRQLLQLNFLLKTYRRSNIGLCNWYKSSHLGISQGSKRRELFNKQMELLKQMELVTVQEVPQGHAASLTLKGELLIKEIEQFITSSYTSIFTQFNLIPVL